MDKNIEIKRKLKEIEAHRLYKMALLGYSKEIIDVLSNNPELIEIVTSELGIDEQSFFESLSLDCNQNVVFYDTALKRVLQLKYRKEINNDNENQ